MKLPKGIRHILRSMRERTSQSGHVQRESQQEWSRDYVVDVLVIPLVRSGAYAFRRWRGAKNSSSLADRNP